MLKSIQARLLSATLMLAIFALIASGCASRESKLVGQWKIDASAIEASQAKAKTPQEKMGMEMARKMLEKITLDVNEDKTFVMNVMGMNSGGEWKLDEGANTLTLTMTKANGQEIPNAASAAQIASKPLTLNISADNTKLTMANTKLTMASPGAAATPGGADAMTFVKVK